MPERVAEKKRTSAPTTARPRNPWLAPRMAARIRRPITSKLRTVAAAVHLNPGGILAWIVLGLLAGAIAGRIARGSGYGCLTDIVLGLIGAFIGGMILSLFTKTDQRYGFLSSLVVALLGALLVIY